VAALRYAGIIKFPDHYENGLSGIRDIAEEYSLGKDFEEKGDILSYFKISDPKKLIEIASGFGATLPNDLQCDLEKLVRDVREIMAQFL
jgi:hypothetical protein